MQNMGQIDAACVAALTYGYKVLLYSDGENLENVIFVLIAAFFFYYSPGITWWQVPGFLQTDICLNKIVSHYKCS